MPVSNHTRKFFKAMIEQGLSVTLKCENDDETDLERSTDMRVIEAELEAADDHHAWFFTRDGKRIAWLYVTLCNDDNEQIIDYTESHYTKQAQSIADG